MQKTVYESLNPTVFECPACLHFGVCLKNLDDARVMLRTYPDQVDHCISAASQRVRDGLETKHNGKGFWCKQSCDSS